MSRLDKNLPLLPEVPAAERLDSLLGEIQELIEIAPDERSATALADLRYRLARAVDEWRRRWAR